MSFDKKLDAFKNAVPEITAKVETAVGDVEGIFKNLSSSLEHLLTINVVDGDFLGKENIQFNSTPENLLLSVINFLGAKVKKFVDENAEKSAEEKEDRSK